LVVFFYTFIVGGDRNLFGVLDDIVGSFYLITGLEEVVGVFLTIGNSCCISCYLKLFFSNSMAVFLIAASNKSSRYYSASTFNYSWMADRETIMDSFGLVAYAPLGS
jgi:hypothetical protein